MQKVLVVDDDESMREWLQARLCKRGYQVQTTGDPAQALPLVDAGAADVVLVDLRMIGLDGLSVCERVTANRPDVPVVLVTAHGSLDTAVAALRAGAFDFVTKPVDLSALLDVIERAVHHRSSLAAVRWLEGARAPTATFGALGGDSLAMRRLLGLLQQVADADAPVLITGESGTGKELVARALHQNGRRRDAAFVPVNCAAVSASLLEAELFGHVKGAFTDARSDRVGLFASAHGGTLFLDEIGEFPLQMQPKLLRVLQDGVIRPVGGNQEVRCDVRVVAATNRDLVRAVAQGEFREDLYYRINVLQVSLPPLRERGADILRYAKEFTLDAARRNDKNVTGFSDQVAQRLMAYDWPGNVRELRNCVERAIALTRRERFGVEDLPEQIRSYGASRYHIAEGAEGPLLSLDEVERQHVLRVLEATGGNKSQAARILGVNRRTLYRMAMPEAEGD